MKKKKICIIFPEGTISYSPTVLSLANELKNFAEVEVLCFDTGDFKINVNSSVNQKFNIIRINHRLYHLLLSTGLHKPYLLLVLFFSILKYSSFDEIIAVDSVALLPASYFCRNIHFLSLEIRKDLYFKFARKIRVSSLVIQSVERQKYLFGYFPRPVFYVNNSSYYKEKLPQKTLPPCGPVNLVYFGNVILEHGVYELIEAIREIDTNTKCTLTLKGSITPEVRKEMQKKYADMLVGEKLKIDSAYLDDTDIVTYLSNFHIGFCFYSFININSKNYYNYYTSPSGKLFQYYNAGVPVIGNNIPGLNSISEFNAGVRIEQVTATEIQDGIKTIMKDYSTFEQNARKAARHYDFRKSSMAFVDYLINN